MAIEMGIPKEKIIVENKATNTGENILFTKKILEDRRLSLKKIILVKNNLGF
jgi:uncharacterized SAM-binding protein YcdF (DUF218 family)